MGKKVLILASVASMIDQFNIPNIKLLKSLGFEVDVATNFEKGSTCSLERIEELKKRLNEMSVDSYQIDFNRKITDVNGIFKAIKQLDDVVKGKKNTISGKRFHDNGEYLFFHCHSPIGGVVGRLVAKRNSIKSIYTAHGFHFFKGAPLKNWFLFYPVEWFFSWFTDVLITINKEDYTRATKHFHAKKIEYVPGVGVDVKSFSKCNVSKQEKRKELGIPENAFVFVSVGELNDNKNHRTIIEALAKINDKKVVYALCGIGNLLDELKNICIELGVEDRVFFLGFRKDIKEILYASDVFVFPSKREGLGLAAIEAMATGLPIITSNIHGIKDYSINGVTGFSCEPTNVNEFYEAMNNLVLSPEKMSMYGAKVREVAKNFDLEIVYNEMNKIYGNFISNN